MCPSGMLPHGRSNRDTFRCNKSDWVDGDGNAGALVLVRLFHNGLKFAGTRILFEDSAECSHCTTLAHFQVVGFIETGMSEFRGMLRSMWAFR